MKASQELAASADITEAEAQDAADQVVLPLWLRLSQLPPKLLNPAGELLVRLNMRLKGLQPGKPANWKGLV